MRISRKLARIPLVAMLAAAAPPRAHAMWVTAYYTGWRQDRLPPADIDFGAVTHLSHFSVVPRRDGGLDFSMNMLTPANIRAAVSAAHRAGKKILFTVGGQDSRERFESALRESRRPAFIAALVSFLRENGYDGIDVDMEEITDPDAEDFARFIRELRARLDTVNPRPLLTAAALWQPGLFARLSGYFDQINLMTYNLSGPYPGWVVWHSGPIYDGGLRFPDGRMSLPSVNGLVEEFLAAGVPKSKLGVGLSFNGYVWSGGKVSRPGQSWETPPAIKNLPYYTLADAYHLGGKGEGSPAYHWDPRVQAAYLSIEGAGHADDRFVSYSDERSARKLVEYVRRKGLGGMIVWDIGAGYRANQPPGRRDGLMQAVKSALFSRREAP